MPINCHERELSGTILGAGDFKLIMPIGRSAACTVLAVKVHPIRGSDAFFSPPEKPRELAPTQFIHLKSWESMYPGASSLYTVYTDNRYMYFVVIYPPGKSPYDMVCPLNPSVEHDPLKDLFIRLIDVVLELRRTSNDPHQSIKPGNITISQDCTELYVRDFGLAWEKAWGAKYGTESTDEDGFSEIYTTGQGDYEMFLSHGKMYLRTKFPISSFACHVLMRIFTPETWEGRWDGITLSNLCSLFESFDPFTVSETNVSGTESSGITFTCEACERGQSTPVHPGLDLSFLGDYQPRERISNPMHVAPVNTPPHRLKKAVVSMLGAILTFRSRNALRVRA